MDIKVGRQAIQEATDKPFTPDKILRAHGKV